MKYPSGFCEEDLWNGRKPITGWGMHFEFTIQYPKKNKLSKTPPNEHSYQVWFQWDKWIRRCDTFTDDGERKVGTIAHQSRGVQWAETHIC